MPKIEKKNFSSPDESRSFSKGNVKLVKLAGVTFGLATFEPGWKWSESVKPIAKTKSCEVGHTLHVLSGRMRTVMDDGTAGEFGPGDVGIIPPGHDAWVVGNSPCIAVDIAGMAEYAKPKK